MIRPDEVVAAIGGKVMEKQGHPFFQGGRVSQGTAGEFSRAGSAWVRYGLEQYAVVSSGFPRWGRYDGIPRLGEDRKNLVFVLEDEVTQLVGETNNPGSTTSWTLVGCEVSTTSPALPSPFSGFSDLFPIVKTDGQTNRGFYQLISASSFCGIQMIGRNFNQALGQEGSFSLVDQGGSGFTYRLRLNFLTGETQRVSSGNSGWRESGSENLGNGWWRYWLSADLSGYTGTPRLEVRLERTSSTTVGIGFYPAYVGAEASRFIHQPLPSTELSTAASVVTKPAETYRLSGIRGASAGPLSLYTKAVTLDRPGEGAAPTLSTSGEFFALAKGWEDGARKYVGGAVFQQDGRIITAASTAPVVAPRDIKEEVARVSTGGFLTYEVSVNGGKVYRVTSTDAIPPTRKVALPRFDLAGDQENVVAILARGNHRLEAFRGFFK